MLNPKIQKIYRQIELTKSKIEELKAILPELEKQRIALENAELIKIFREPKTEPADFTEFVEALQVSLNIRRDEHDESQENDSEQQEELSLEDKNDDEN
jgi:hypothetical protein